MKPLIPYVVFGAVLTVLGALRLYGAVAGVTASPDQTLIKSLCAS